MGRLARFICLVALFTVTAAAQAQTKVVTPAQLERATQLELGELILLLMPDKGTKTVEWSHRADSPIVWQTSGFAEQKRDPAPPWYYRLGLTRVRVGTAKATILKTTTQELGWSVMYETFGLPRFGPEAADITPGVPRMGEHCFGANAAGCTFDVGPSLASAGIKARQLCKRELLSQQFIGWMLSHPTREDTLMSWTTSEGSGGTSSSLRILFKGDKAALCGSAAEEKEHSQQEHNPKCHFVKVTGFATSGSTDLIRLALKSKDVLGALERYPLRCGATCSQGVTWLQATRARVVMRDAEYLGVYAPADPTFGRPPMSLVVRRRDAVCVP